MAQKIRLDQYLVDFGLSNSLTEAKSIIMANKVLVNDQPIDKVGTQIKVNSHIRIRGQKNYPSRAAYKLISALDHFQFDVKNKVVLDCGCSHGGFTKVLIERLAKKVIAVDVAYGIFDMGLRNHLQVELVERMNIRQLQLKDISESPNLFVADLSFISLRIILAQLKKIFPMLEGLVLFKPQFEANSNQVKEGLIEEKFRESVVRQFFEWLLKNEIQLLGQTSEILKGKMGNQEIFLHIRWD